MDTKTLDDHLETGLLTVSAGGVNLGVRFFVELGAYASLAYWGVSTGTTEPSRVVLAILAPLVALVVWTLYLAPKARRRLADPTGIAVELVIFVSSAVALASSGQTALAAIFGCVSVANTVFVRVFGHQARRRATV